MGDKDFFLTPDDAQSMGDINYMRRSVRVRKTFPKTLKNKDGFAIEKEVSATEVRNDSSFKGNSNTYASSQTDFKAMAEEIKAVPQSNTQSGKTDTNLDMFRNMARNIKKKY